MSSRGTIFIASDFILDEPWLAEIAAALTQRGYEVIHGPTQKPPKRTEFAREDWDRFFGRTDIILSTVRSIYPTEIFDHAPRVRGIVFPTIGTECVDLEAAGKIGIIVAHGPTPQNFNSMGESTVLLMLAMMYDLHGTEDVLRINTPRPKLCRARMMMGKTVGLIGLGRIARSVVERLSGWGVRILATNRSMSTAHVPPGVELVTLEELMRQSDIVSLHATLTPETRHMVGAGQLALMKPDAYLINTARGGLIDDDALLDALRTQRIAGAALDTFEIEPLPMDSPLRQMDNVILTPHMVGHTQEIYTAITPTALENIERIMRGDMPLYCRNPDTEAAWRARLARLARQPEGCF